MRRSSCAPSTVDGVLPATPSFPSPSPTTRVFIFRWGRRCRLPVLTSLFFILPSAFLKPRAAVRSPRSAANCPLRRLLGPLNDGAPFLHGAVSQEQIDQVLIGHSQLCRHSLEVVHRRNIKADGDLALELTGVWILAGLGKIVFTSHRSLQYTSSSCAVARLAEISRIMEPDSR